VAKVTFRILFYLRFTQTFRLFYQTPSGDCIIGLTISNLWLEYVNGLEHLVKIFYRLRNLVVSERQKPQLTVMVRQSQFVPVMK
jgi:hypothetical protein